MGIITDKSEYAGIRIAMHDALQRYYALDSSSMNDDKKSGHLLT